MPKHFKIRYVFLAVPLLIVGLFALFMLVECSWVAREKSYYTEKDNFVAATATITSIREYEDGTLYLELGQIESNTVFSDIAFKLLPKSASKVRYEGFFAEVKTGDRITFVAAPRLFGDGYAVPIVCISAEGKEYLPFDIGHSHLMEYYE